MPVRATLLFLLLVAAPLLLIVWLGGMLLRQQNEHTQRTFLTISRERLLNHQRLIEEEIRRLEGAFDTLLLETPSTSEALRELPREQPLIRHAFLLDSNNQLLFPPSASADPNSEASAFLRRTESVWETGLKPSAALNEAEAGSNVISPQRADTSSNSSWTILKQTTRGPAITPSRNQGKPAAAISTNVSSGWHLWFHGNGPRLLFWQEKSNRQIVGLELEMPALISLLINRLSDPTLTPVAGLMRLLAANGRSVLHQWGNGNGDTNTALPSIAEIPCTAPLNMWRLDYLPDPDETPRMEALPILLGSGGACLALITVAILFHRDSTREMREARRRVSFVNQVSHELKTPLTNIRLYTELAQQQAEQTNDPDINRHLQVVEAETSRLSRLIHNVLTFARQQRDQLTVHPKPTLLDPIVQRVVETWRPTLESKGFTVQLETNAPQTGNLDPDAIEQILGNLLSNVEKYAADGQHVLIRTQQDSTHLHLIVEDRGPGIPAAQLDSIFAPFVRARNDLTEGVSGTGIGLTISRQLAHLHHGTLTATNLHPGTRFTLTLPAVDLR
ncbi:HAMP domain-containing histidine kinase [Phragmitibacter flavus]|uniref:histidine kinase n=1 Tax=Phragmitibacter flavus TaxID=2576071 RepID=A0A5R8KK32_9BACT|nr:HAMP domain-containing sensor histidine kinase [Phragmitibacter flavus]TLD72683.1 HAMP domain-containing histidine kinase [Phragmitibacter flavus]